MNPSYPDNYLTESKCILLKNQMRKDFFSRLDRVSMRHFQPNIIKEGDSIPKIKLPSTILTSQMKKRKISERIRVYNRSHMKRKQSTTRSVDLNEEKMKEEIEEQVARANKKAEMPKIEKRVIVDPNAPKYETKYIEKVEKQFIYPYINDNAKCNVNYTLKKKSKIPFNFNIGN